MIQLPPRVTVVLGSGGAGGWMFHLGVLRALQSEADFLLSDASRVIATSAGAGVAAPVLMGTSPADTEAAKIAAHMEHPNKPRRLVAALLGGLGRKPS